MHVKGPTMSKPADITIPSLDTWAKAAAKEISTHIRSLGIKHPAAIQGYELRVTGKNRDDLQGVIAACRTEDFPVALSFVNFRD